MKGKRTSVSRIYLSFVFKLINRLRNERKGVITSGQDPTLINFQLLKGNKKKSLDFRVMLYFFNVSSAKAETG